MEELRKAKAQCLEDITRNLPNYEKQLVNVDERLLYYIQDAVSNDGSHANIYELLGIRKVLRLMDSYELNPHRVQLVIRAIEGVWNKGVYVKGGLKFDTPRGNMNVRLMPYQVWCLFGIYGFVVDVPMDREYHPNDSLLPTEFVKDGMVYDARRLCTEAHIFQTRKSGKTEFGAAIDFTEVCFLGPANGQALICTNSSEQSKIAYKAIKEFAYQIDPSCMNKMGGKYFRVTSNEMNWQPGHRRKGEIKVMSAGGKTKDGLHASLVHADEHGQAGYVKGSSDMQALVDVCYGSMGTRREKLLLHTTTAGLVHEGPYKNQIDHVEQTLLTELQHPLGEPCRTEDDYWFAFLLRLDPWELDYSLDELDDTELFKKVNRSIGVTVQPNWYKERLYAARSSEDTRKEVLTKDFNIWQTEKVKKWAVTPDEIRKLQKPLEVNGVKVEKITDCLYSQGWSVFVGLDFSSGDDLFAMSMLGVNYAPGLEMSQRFFADTYLWILEAALQKSPNRQFFEQLIEQKWLRVCPGKVFNPDYAINELMSLNEMGINLAMFGYDPAQSHDPINTIKAWLQSLKLTAPIINDMVVPVSQSAMTLNPLVQKIERYTLASSPWLTFSANPLWPWMFGNVVLVYSRDGTLCRPQKSGDHRKIDGVAALLDALAVFDISESKIKQ